MPVVRELISRFGFQVDKKGFDKADKGFSKLKAAATAVVGVLVAGKVAKTISNITTQAAAMADQIDKTSKRLGVNAMALQELQFAANLAGASNADVTTGLRTLARTADEAASGSAEYADEFRRLGVRVRDSSGRLKSAEVLITEMADGMGRLQTDTERVAVAQKLLGRGGTMLIPLLVQGTEAIKAQREEARELGLFDEDLIELGVDLTDTNRRMAQVMTAVKNVIAKALLPGIIKTKKAIIDWYKANKDWIRQRLGTIVRRLAESVGRLLRFAVRITRAFIDWAESLDPLSAGFLKIAGIAGALALLLALPAGSILLLIGLIALIIDDFLVWQQKGESVIGAIDEALGGLFSAMAEGELFIFDLGTAWEFYRDKAIGAVKAIVEFIKQSFIKIGQYIEEKTLVGRLLGAGARIAGTIAGGGGLAEIGAAIAPGPAVARAAPGGGTQIVNAPRTTISVDVQARTGATAEEIGSQVAQQVDERMVLQYRGAQAALTPAK